MATPAVETSVVDWIERDRHVIVGLDHLGVQVVSASIYSLLLPGITNVTDRARYYSFYPWVLHRFAQQAKPESGRPEWLTWFRRLEYAYAAACAAWEHAEGEPATAVVGVDTARRAIRDIRGRGPLDLRGPADLDEAGKIGSGAYFKNSEGGLGQYYKVPLTLLGLMREDREYKYPDRQLTTYAGRPLAEAVHRSFEDLLEVAGRRVTVSQLADLGKRVGPSAITPGGKEETMLRHLFLGEGESASRGQSADGRAARRRSLLLMLKFAEDCGDTVDNEFSTEFRWACSARTGRDGRAWRLDGDLEAARRGWAAYHGNDLMNAALESLFWLVLRRIEDDKLRPRQVAAAVAELACGSSHRRQDDIRLNGTVGDWVAACSESAAKRSLRSGNDVRTRTWADDLFNAVSEEDDGLVAHWAVRLLGRLAASRGREEDALSTFSSVTRAYEVHRDALCQRTEKRAGEPLALFLETLILEWVLYRHLRVATRKLAAQGVSTFKFRPEEGVLINVADEIPEPSLTNPRVRQAHRILVDLHYLEETESGSTRLTADAGKVLGKA